MIRFFGFSSTSENLDEETEKEIIAGLSVQCNIYRYLILLNQCPRKLYCAKDYAGLRVTTCQISAKVFATSETIEMMRTVVLTV